MSEQPTIASTTIYTGKIVSLKVDTIQFPDGRTAKREIVEHPGGICIVPLDADGQVYMIKQYRKPVERLLLELPAGTREPDESPEVTAQRELGEEIGYHADHLRLLTTYYASPGYCSEELHIYLATGLRPTGQALDVHEVAEVVTMPLAEAMQRIADGSIRDSKTIIGLTLAERSLM